MRCGRIRNGENLFRHCIHPISFRGPRFAPEKIIKIEERDGFLLASLAWERFVPTSKFVHDYGCRLAFGMNNRDRAAARYKEKNRKIYCGAYQLRADAVRALAAIEGIATADVVHHVEMGEIAHVDVRIVLRPGADLDAENTKTAIVDRLWNACRGPLRHVCSCEAATSPHPSAALITGPQGKYSDNRPSLLRLWSILRFYVCVFLCQRSLKDGQQ